MALSAQDLAAFHAVQLPTAQTATKKKTTGRGGTLTSLISEVGGTGGALGGAAAGAALGSVVPVVGTVAGGLIGAGIGGFLGGTGGRIVENKVRDDRVGLSDALTEGAISGIAGAGPLRLAKGGLLAGKAVQSAAKGGASSLASALTKSGAKTAVEDIAGNTASKAATQSAAPLKSSLQGKLQEFGNKRLGAQYGTISTPVIRETNPSQTIGQLADIGITKPQDAERIAKAVTGSDGLVNRAVSKAVGGSAALDTKSLPAVVDKAVTSNGMVDNAAKGLKAEIQADLDLIDPSKPDTALKVMRNLEARKAEYLGKGNTYHMATSLDKKRAKAITQVHDEIQKSLDNSVAAKGNVAAVLTPDFRNQLVALNPNNAQWVSHVDNKIMKSKTIGDLRAAQSPFVRVGKIIDAGDNNAFSAGGRVGNSIANGQIPTVQSMAIQAGSQLVKNPANRAVGTLARKLGGADLQGGTSLASSLTAPTKKAIIRNGAVVGAGGAALGGTEAADAAELPVDPAVNQMLSPDQQTSQSQGLDGQMTNDAGIAVDQTNDPFDPANLQTNIKKLLAGGGTLDDVTQYISLVKTINDLTATGGGKINATTGGQLASSSNGLNTLDQLQGLYDNAGGGSGRIAGGLQNVLAKVGANNQGQTYNDLSASSVSQLAKALNGGGTVSDTDAAVVIQALPKITDSPEVAKAKFLALKQRLEQARQNTLLYGGVTEDQITQ